MGETNRKIEEKQDSDTLFQKLRINHQDHINILYGRIEKLQEQIKQLENGK